MNKLFNADYRYFRGKGEEIDLSGVYSFNTQFSIIGKYNYSFSNNRRDVEDLIDTMIGIEYDSCCYSLKIVARDYWTGVKKDNALFFEFLPKGLTTTNNKTSALLEEEFLVMRIEQIMNKLKSLFFLILFVWQIQATHYKTVL